MSYDYDKEGERESARDDAITACGERIAADPVKLREVVEAMLIDTDVDVPELLALLYNEPFPEIFSAHSKKPCGGNEAAKPRSPMQPGLHTVIRNITVAISAAIDKTAESEVDEAMAEAEQARWARRHLGGRD